MSKIILEVEISEEGLLAKMAAVEEARRVLNNAIADLENTITGRYNTIKPGAKVIEKPEA